MSRKDGEKKSSNTEETLSKLFVGDDVKVTFRVEHTERFEAVEDCYANLPKDWVELRNSIPF